jgi:cobalamin 5'-phosphate synthase/cobalamin synthase
MAAGLRRTLDGALFAITFLTILPLRLRDERDAGGTAAAWYPLVGAAVGAIAGGIFAVAEPALGASVAAIAAVGTLVVLTGGLHQDGLADCADGMGVRGDLERRLAVMRDPATGSFGTLALILWALLLTASLAQLSRGDAVAALVTSAAVGRWSALLQRPLGTARAQGRAGLRVRSVDARRGRRGAHRRHGGRDRRRRQRSRRRGHGRARRGHHQRLVAPRPRRPHGRHARRRRRRDRSRGDPRPAGVRSALVTPSISVRRRISVTRGARISGHSSHSPRSTGSGGSSIDPTGGPE